MKEVELKYLDMSTVLKPSDAYAVVLEEIGGEHRRLALIIGTWEAQAIRVVQMPYRMPRPFTHDLILDILHEEGMFIRKALIYEVKDGVYYSYLYITRSDNTEFKIDARTTDVISLSLRKMFPIYVYEDILEREKLRDLMSDQTFGLTVNSVDMKMLKTALEEAVSREDYETASQLRDEIKRREEIDTDDEQTE